MDAQRLTVCKCGNRKTFSQKQCRICSYAQMVETKRRRHPRPELPKTLFIRLAEYWPQQWGDSWTWGLLSRDEQFDYAYVKCHEMLKQSIRNHLANHYQREFSEKDWHEFMRSPQIGGLGDETTEFLEYFECHLKEYRLAMRFTFKKCQFIVTFQFLAPSGSIVGSWELNDLIDRKTWDEQWRLVAQGFKREAERHKELRQSDDQNHDNGGGDATG